MITRDRKKPLHSQIREQLIEQLESYNDGDRLPTEMDFSEKFGVSRLTVHKVINELSRDGYVVRRAGRGTFVRHGDRRVHTGEFHATNGNILMAYPDWFSFDFWTKIRRVRQLAHTNSMGLVDYMITRETMYASIQHLLVKQKDLRGLVVIPPGDNIPEDVLRMFDGLGVPVVIIGSMLKVPEDLENVYTVCQDHTHLGYSDISYLFSHGHKDIGFITSEPWGESWSHEVQGMKRALSERGLPASCLRLPEKHTRPWEDATQMAYEMTHEVLEDPLPIALIFESFPSAMAGLKAVREHPRIQLNDLAVVVNSPWLGLETYLHPSPIMIYCDPIRLSEEAFQIINSPSRPSGSRILVEDLTVRDLKISCVDAPPVSPSC